MPLRPDGLTLPSGSHFYRQKHISKIFAEHSKKAAVLAKLLHGGGAGAKLIDEGKLEKHLNKEQVVRLAVLLEQMNSSKAHKDAAELQAHEDAAELEGDFRRAAELEGDFRQDEELVEISLRDTLEKCSSFPEEVLKQVIYHVIVARVFINSTDQVKLGELVEAVGGAKVILENLKKVYSCLPDSSKLFLLLEAKVLSNDFKPEPFEQVVNNRLSREDHLVLCGLAAFLSATTER